MSHYYCNVAAAVPLGVRTRTGCAGTHGRRITGRVHALYDRDGGPTSITLIYPRSEDGKKKNNNNNQNDGVKNYNRCRYDVVVKRRVVFRRDNVSVKRLAPPPGEIVFASSRLVVLLRCRRRRRPSRGRDKNRISTAVLADDDVVCFSAGTQ